LTPITRGFWFSAGVAIIGTVALAFFMMQGIKSTTYRDIEGNQVSALRKLEMRDFRVMYAMNNVELGVSAPNATKPATPPARMSDADLAMKSTEFLDKLHADFVKNKPPQSPAVAKFKPVTVEEVKVYREDPVRNYTMLNNGMPQAQLPDIGRGTDNKFFVAKISRPGMPNQATPNAPAKPIENWQFMPESQMSSPIPGMTIKETAEANLAVSTANGDIYWVIGKDVKDKKAYSALPPFDFSETKHVAEPMGNMEPVEKDGSVTTVIQSGRPVEWWRFCVAIIVGILMAYLIERITDYFVSFEKKPVREIAAASTAGPAPMIIQGFAYAMESAVWSVLTIVLALLAPLFIFPPAEFGGYILSFYGIALVGLGLLTTTGYILAMDTFGPISDNAQGVYQMSGAEATETVQEGSMPGSRAVQRLDAAGNTTKALTKGFAIATAVVAAVALFHSFIEDARITELGLRIEIPEIFIGLLIGGAAPFLFSAFSINAVGRAAFQLIGEVRRQFSADPGIMAGTSKPDYGRCVSIVTSAAQKELLGPGILAIAFPVLVGFGLAIGKAPVMIGGTEYNLVGAQALGGFLAGAILSGQLLAVTLANSGGAWDNSKKLIEDGMYGGKGSEAHKAGVVCDTVGDPFKDTAGPALNPLIKVMNLVALLLAPVVITKMDDWVRYLIVGLAVVALAIAVFWSKRGSIGTELAKSAGALTEEPVH
ncbi:MAG: sodium/proton-translocating pyrophosphatase, partial [Armatimonadetes bacterium]|nr:sodium/proton-translocating pyrophosphatase [Armatimonadota bacterium]